MGIDLLSGSSTGYHYGILEGKRVGGSQPANTSHLTNEVKNTLLRRCGKVNSGLRLPVKHKFSHLSEIKVKSISAVTVMEMKGQSMTEVESQQHETDTEQKRYPHTVFLSCAAHPKSHMSRLERYGHVQLTRRCDLWLFYIHHSILLPVAPH